MKRYILLAAKTAIGLFLLLVLFILAVRWNVFGKIYTEEELVHYKNETASVVLSENEVVLGKYFDKNRTNANFEELPKHLINALVATEDARFFEHDGVDTRSLLRVLFKSILSGDKRSGGGSTISQQLAKNMFGRSNHGFLSLPVNKTKEIIQAKRIESIFSKENILTLYFNTVAFGENVYGIESAALRYFNKKVSDLNIEESAVLVGILKANTYYNPNKNPDNALMRRNVVLNQMHRYEYINEKTADSLKQLPLKLNYNNLTTKNKAGHFLTYVKKEAIKIIDSINKADKTSYDIEKDGLVISTTLNEELQDYATEAFASHLSDMQEKIRAQYQRNKYQKRILNTLVEAQLKQMKIHPDSAKVKRKQSIFSWKESKTDSISTLDSLKLENTILHAGLLALSPKTGAVKAYVGGIDNQRYAYDQIFSQRQLASTFKPILYATAFESGKHPCYYLDNDSIQLKDYKNWSPKNADNTFGGKYSMQGALLNSKNIPTINLYLETDFEKLDTIWSRLKFSSRLKNVPSLALGTTNASIYEVANAYSVFANSGKATTPYTIVKIETSSGEVLFEHKHKSGKEALSKQSTAYINEILQKAISRGTGQRLRSQYGVTLPLAGKTGTSQDYTDAWFVGYNPNIVVVSRVGCDSPKIHFNSGLGAGSSLAMPLVAKTLKKAESNAKLRKELNAHFSPLTEFERLQLDCEDFKEKTGVEKFFELFKKQETSYKKEQEKAKRKAERKKKGFFKRLFGKD
ncbi:transglycosylase domain-containing protein [Oceanihabitans sediminis]|uniref:transglycosylase domain-containing protein n=1 Tax=Oceanihabitans sediminis TaxID=1812012 RepID=UPI00299F3BFF|nr:transglycosylase domain-containing protein [Oceanihabitans sediminis]MDX1773366.1 transglycosylase domain-containing protein [Oceanihabitans sediminis]